MRAEPTHSAGVGNGASSTLITFSAAGAARRRLICMPFAGGGPSTYRLWPKTLPSDVEVVVVVLPGRDPRARLASGHAAPGTMADLLPPVLDALDALQASSPLPFAVFGHSMGSLVAFELTVALEARGGASPTHLFVSGRRPPDELHTGATIHHLPEQPFLDRMNEEYGGVPDVVRNEPELLALFLPGLRADVQVFETYAPLTDRLVRCPVRVYGGETDRRPRPERLPGWQRVAARPISVRVFPGDHFYLNPARDELTADIAEHWVDAPAGRDVPSAGAGPA